MDGDAPLEEGSVVVVDQVLALAWVCNKRSEDFGGAALHRGSRHASHLAALGLVLGIPPKNYLLMLVRFFDVRCLKQWTEAW